METGTIIMLIIILALFCVTCFLVAKSVQMANAKAAKELEAGQSPADPDPQQ